MIKGRDQKVIVKKLQTEIQKAGLDALILTSADGVFYSTGFAVRSLYRSGKTGNAAAVVTADGDVALICSEFEKNAAVMVCDPSIRIEAYPVWIYIEDYATEQMTKEVQPDLNKTYHMAVNLIPSKKDGVKIGVQSKWVTYESGCYLRKVFGDHNVVDCTKILSDARITKTPWEIEVLRHNAQLAEKAMNITAKTIVPGMTTVDVHHIFHKTCLELAPDMTAVSQSHTVGSDFAPAWIPQPRRIERGDLIRLDGGPYTDGYKSDLGRTYAIGGAASKDKEELYAALWRGYEFAVQHMGPGVKMSDIFHGTQQAIGIKNYVRGHHGHSISCDISGEEAPFFAPGETRILEPGMVLCFETPFYSSTRQTYNIEDTLLVTENGIELFTKASPSLYF